MPEKDTKESPKIHCRFDKLVNLDDLQFHPQNYNRHPKEQITRLAKILDYQGWRYPIKVSNQSGYITAGHGRVLAAKELGWSQAPANFQDYDSPDQEYADLQADNAIAEWSFLDTDAIRKDLQSLDVNFDPDLLGILDFKFEEPVTGNWNPKDEWEGMPEFDNADLTAKKRLVVNFASDEDVQAFARLVDQRITEKTRSIWFPKAEIDKYMDKRYATTA